LNMKADLHIHSLYTNDAISKPESILAAASDRGLKAIAITDIETDAGWKELKDLSSKYSVEVILGQEVRVHKNGEIAGELLCLFLREPIHSNTVDRVIKDVRNQDGIVSIAHPFSERQIEFRAFAEIKDWRGLAIEALNGRSYNHRDNEMASNLAERLNSPVTAGSDAHTPFELGTCFVEWEGKSSKRLKAAILNRDIGIGGHPSSAFFSLLSGFGRFGIAI